MGYALLISSFFFFKFFLISQTCLLRSQALLGPSAVWQMGHCQLCSSYSVDDAALEAVKKVAVDEG